MSKPQLATLWLDGCSGCHMSLLDMDERILEIAEKADLVYSPLVDAKKFPPEVDIALVEGAVGTVDDLHKIKIVRERTKFLVSLGDCAVTANVPSMRNAVGPAAVLQRAYIENASLHHQLPVDVPELLARVRPVHEVVRVDVFVPGCPPSADTIYYVLNQLLNGLTPDINQMTRFGA